MRNRKEVTQGTGLFRRSAAAVRRLLSKSGRGSSETVEAAPEKTPNRVVAEARPSRPPRRDSDIPLDVLDRAYTPAATSSKASFRSDGADHQMDQEFATGVADSRWNDEDRYTNKSGDPRIGTHGRSYEPAESREESRD